MGTEPFILMICGVKSVSDVGWLPKDVVPLLVLINLYDEWGGGPFDSPLYLSTNTNTASSTQKGAYICEFYQIFTLTKKKYQNDKSKNNDDAKDDNMQNGSRAGALPSVL